MPIIEAKPLILVAAAALLDADGRLLVATRPSDKSMPGLWEFPGGKLRANETPEICVIRELREELAIDVHSSCLAPAGFASHAYDDFHLLMPLFVCRKWEGQIVPQEGQNLQWLYPSALFDLPMPPADRPLIAILRDML